MLAQELSPRYTGRADVIVLALPRGGVPVACEVAAALAAPLDILMVRKVAAPHHAHCLLGAIASGGCRAIDERVVSELRIPPEAVAHAVEHAACELSRREHAYRGPLFGPSLRGQCVIVVDDGAETGSTMRAALQAARRQDPARIVIAVPVAPEPLFAAMAGEVDEVVCLWRPQPFLSIKACYEDFRQVTDEKARQQLEAFAQAGGRTALAAF